ncbi:MAG: sulfatase [Bryobacterales bacterium]|nr:sulfatase [Bryobacterales bacterium]
MMLASRLPAMLAAAALAHQALAAAADLPNFVVIMTDDQGYGDLGVQGHPSIRTPRIDRMAAEGLRLTDYYAQPFCGPARAALMTGTYPPRNSLMFNHMPRARTGIHPNEVTIAELLRDRGYATAMLGKWHLGDAPEFLPTRHGFDSYYGLPYSNDMWPFHPKIERAAEEGERMRHTRERTAYTGYAQSEETYPRDWFPPLPLMENERVVERNPRQESLSAAYTDRAIEFIRASRDRPFFVYIAHSMPHVPLFRGRAFRDKSLRGLYGDVIEEIDHHTGRLLDTLGELGIEERTLVIFTSDNGPWTGYGIDAGSAGLLRGGKGTVYEGGIRVPAILRWPGTIPAGLVSSEVASVMDILPTLAQLSGGGPPRDRTIDGRDLEPLWAGPGKAGGHEALYFFEGGLRYRAEDGPPQNDLLLGAVRAGPWKLHLGAEPDGKRVKVLPGELYQIYWDPGESRDVADKHPEVVERLTEQAQSFLDSLRNAIRPLGRLAD